MYLTDDWATSVENAIANALKKDGVQPPMPSLSNHHDDNESSEVPTKRRKREKHKVCQHLFNFHCILHAFSISLQKKQSPDKLEEMDEVDLEYEMLNVRGGSPRPTLGAGGKHPDRSDTEDSYTSDESRDHERERDRDRDRERDRERRDRDRERDREYNRRKRKNRQRNRANRDGRKRKRDDSDVGFAKRKLISLENNSSNFQDDKHHSRSNGPRKMELCKFYLMDCCAKREKCLYMHSDFPCKYYYLGLKCKEKEKCLFSHGEPLTDELRAILMKHLETAPQEILGDFPRISRESAATMVNATHRKLMEKFGITEKPATDNTSTGGKIPSLLDMIGASDRGNKNRRSRWCEKSGSSNHGSSKASDGSGDDFLSLKYLTGVISQDQIVNLEKMGIHNLDQISQLTVAQLNELGLSISQIHELQLNALNMKTLRDNIAKQDTKSDDPDFVETTHHKDLDMRITPSHSALQKDASDIPPLGGKDVDMRVLPLVTVQEAAGGDNSSSQEGQLELVSTSLNSLIKTPTVDYSQYLKDSNLNDDDEMYNTENADKLLIAHDYEDDDDDENNLKISIDDEEQDENGRDNFSRSDNEERKEENKPFKLQPAVFDTALVSNSLATHKIDYTKPFGMYRSAEEETVKSEESCILDRYGSDSESARRKSDMFNQKSMYDMSSGSTSETSSGVEASTTYKVTNSPNSLTLGWTPTSGNVTSTHATKSTIQPTKPSRPSIYDDPCASDNSDDSDSKSKTSMYGDRDKDMRLNFIHMDGKLGEDSDAPNDIDLRLPFKPIMTNYIPATEIDGSITSHPAIPYKVYSKRS